MITVKEAYLRFKRKVWMKFVIAYKLRKVQG